ncbi:Protein BCK2 [Nakaseomyces bracarensis]|uniref:Protein BCK2 n=1 Tax=Nakaseomyces bracarensis TaxID=273131 RepID=A0ABR4NX84_9SACH
MVRSRSSSNSGKLKITSDAMNKWKIPHYYKRSGKNSVTSTPVSEVTNSPLRSLQNEHTSTPSNVSSPKKIVLEDRNRATPRSRKSTKKGQMVFVNYTVQDEDTQQSPLQQQLQQQQQQQHQEQIQQQQQLQQQQQRQHDVDQNAINAAMKDAMILDNKNGLTNKRKSSRRRMLKIFGSSKEDISSYDNSVSQPVENGMDSSSNTSSSSSTPNSARKSYGSFLKCNKLCGENNYSNTNTNNYNKKNTRTHNNNASVDFNAALGNNVQSGNYKQNVLLNNNGAKSADELLNFLSQDEIVPKSSHDPSLAKPPRAPITDRKRSISSSSIPMKVASSISLNSKVTKPSRKLSTTTTISNASSQNTPFIEFENPDFSDSYQIQDSYYHGNDNLSSASLASFISNPNTQDNNHTISSDITQVDTADKLTNYPIANMKENGEDNDASVAFTKMFSRKRANTGGSTGSTTSMNAMQPGISSKTMVTKMTNHRTTSMNSLSSASNKFSPIRTVSPVRPRSNTRTSSGFRQSRDLTAVASSIVANDTNISTPGSEVFLDTQGKRSVGHKKKQESISEFYKFQGTPTASNNQNSTIATTPSSLLGTSYFSNNLVSQNNYSNTSTPAATDVNALGTNYFSGKTVVNNSRQTSDISILTDKDFQLDVEVFENSDIPTPVERMQPIRGISVTAIQEIDEEEKANENEENSHQELMNMINSENVGRKTSHSFQEKYDNNDFQNNIHGGSCTSSSAMESLMTNYLYPTHSNGTGQNSQERDEQIITNNEFDELNFDLFGKPNSGQVVTENINDLERVNEHFETSYQYNFEPKISTGHNPPQQLNEVNNQHGGKKMAFNVNPFQTSDIDYIKDESSKNTQEFSVLSNDLYFGNQL